MNGDFFFSIACLYSSLFFLDVSILPRFHLCHLLFAAFFSFHHPCSINTLSHWLSDMTKHHVCVVCVFLSLYLWEHSCMWGAYPTMKEFLTTRVWVCVCVCVWPSTQGNDSLSWHFFRQSQSHSWIIALSLFPFFILFEASSEGQVYFYPPTLCVPAVFLFPASPFSPLVPLGLPPALSIGRTPPGLFPSIVPFLSFYL